MSGLDDLLGRLLPVSRKGAIPRFYDLRTGNPWRGPDPVRLENTR